MPQRKNIIQYKMRNNQYKIGLDTRHLNGPSIRFLSGRGPSW